MLSHDASLFNKLPHDILASLFDKYLTAIDIKILNQTSKTLYWRILHYKFDKFAKINSLKDEDKSSLQIMLVMLATHIHEADDQKKWLIKALRHLVTLQPLGDQNQALALACLARLTPLSHAEKVCSIALLKSTPSALARGILAFLPPTLLTTPRPCEVHEVNELKENASLPIQSFCVNLLGVRLTLPNTLKLSNREDSKLDYLKQLPPYVAELAMDAVLTAHQHTGWDIILHLKPKKSACSTTAIDRLALILKATANHDHRYRFLLTSIINQIRNDEIEKAREKIMLYASRSDMQKRRYYISSVLQIFIRHRHHAFDLFKLIIGNDVLCHGNLGYLGRLLPLTSRDDLIQILPVLAEKLTCHDESEKFWELLSLFANDSELAYVVIQNILSALIENQYPFLVNPKIEKSIRLLNQEMRRKIFDTALSRLNFNNKDRLHNLIELLSKGASVETAEFAISSLWKFIKTANFLNSNGYFAKIILAFAKIIDVDGREILGPLFIRIINPQYQIAESREQLINFKIMFNYIYEYYLAVFNLSAINASSLYDDLSQQQIISIWHDLKTNFHENMKSTPHYITIMKDLAFLFPSSLLSDVEAFLIFQPFNNRKMIELLQKIKLINTLSETKVIRIINGIIAAIPSEGAPEVFNNIYREILFFIPKFNSNSFNQYVIDLLWKSIAPENEDELRTLRRFHEVDEATFHKILTRIYQQQNVALFFELIKTFSLLEADKFSEIIPFIKGWARYTNYRAEVTITALLTLLSHINQLNEKEVEALSKEIHFAIRNSIDFSRQLAPLFHLYLPLLSNSQKIELYEYLCSYAGTPIFYFPLIKQIINASEDIPAIEFIKIIANHEDLLMHLGFYFPNEKLLNLPAPDSYENFAAHYLDLSALRNATADIPTIAHEIVQCVRQFDVILGKDDVCKQLYFLHLMKHVYKSSDDRHLITCMVLMEIATDYLSPSFAFLGASIQGDHVIQRFKDLLINNAPLFAWHNIAFEALGKLDHHYAPLILIRYLTEEGNLQLRKEKCIEYIKDYCRCVTNPQRLDDLTRELLEARTTVLADIFNRTGQLTTYSLRGDTLSASRYTQFGIKNDECCSHTWITILSIIEERKREIAVFTPI